MADIEKSWTISDKADPLSPMKPNTGPGLQLPLASLHSIIIIFYGVRAENHASWYADEVQDTKRNGS